MYTDGTPLTIKVATLTLPLPLHLPLTRSPPTAARPLAPSYPYFYPYRYPYP